MKKLAVSVAAFSLFGAFILARSVWSQQPVDRALRRDNAFPPFSDPTKSALQYAPSSHSDIAARSEIGRLMNQLREASDAQKPELTKQLESAVDKYFDDDMKARETELTKLEERLSKLRNQLDRRRKAKAEIIQLQIKVLLNEADGLGFTGASFFEGYLDGSGRIWPEGPGNVRYIPAVVPRMPMSNPERTRR